MLTIFSILLIQNIARKTQTATKKPWWRGVIGLAVLQIWRKFRKFHTFCEKEIAKLLPKTLQEQQKHYSTDDRCLLFEEYLLDQTSLNYILNLKRNIQMKT